MTSENSRERIKKALASLMMYKSLDSITITEIATTAKVNRSTYYYYYYKKEEILDEISNECISDLVTAMKSPYKDGTEMKINEDILPSTMKLFEHIYQQKHYYYTLLNYEKGLEFQNELLQVVINFFKNETAVIYVEHIDNESFDNEMNSTYHAYGIFGMIKNG